jgi:hypothetical protein
VVATALESLTRAFDLFGRLVDAVRLEQWTLPTRCDAWGVQQLADHVVSGQWLFARVVRGDPLEPAMEQAGDAWTGQRVHDPPPPSSAANTAYTLHCSYSLKWGRCRVEGKQVRIPAGARTEGNRTATDTSASPDANAYFNQPDAHLTVVDQWADVESDLWRLHTSPVPAGGGTLSFTYGGVRSGTAPGCLTSRPGQRRTSAASRGGSAPRS